MDQGPRSVFQNEPEYLKRFCHEPLDLSKQSIRLVKVLKDPSPLGNIQCNVWHTTTAVQYDCLSYCWCPDIDDNDDRWYRQIEINGRLFDVLPNLWSFLNVCRWSETRRPLWIDAICIDQRATLERNHQVQSMANIYSHAAEVVIWLGAGDGNQRHALGALRSQTLEMDKSFPLKSLLALCENRYWGRMWIVQEIMLARKLVLMYDNQRLPWSNWTLFHLKRPYSDLTDDILTLNHRERFEDSNGRLMVFEYFRFRKLHEGMLRERHKLTDLLTKFGESECSDVRDRVFALLGLCEEGVNGVIEVDYGMSKGQLFDGVVRSCFADSLTDARLLARVLELGSPTDYFDWRFPDHG